MGSILRMTEPYRAAIEGKWQEVKSFYEHNDELMHTSLTPSGDTALHVAVYSGDTDLLDFLLQIVKSESDFMMATKETPFRITNNYGQTALHEAAGPGSVTAAALLLSYDENLLSVQSESGETALFRAAAFGRTKFIKYLASKIKGDVGPPHLRRKDDTPILHIAILGRFFGYSFFLFKSLFLYNFNYKLKT